MLEEWVVALAKRSSLLNLIGPDEMRRIWPRHILESFAYAQMLDPSRPVLDAGSGCGLPGIPLALLGYRVTLLEPRRKRYLFLRYSTETLGIPARAVRGRLEEVAGEAPNHCQFVCRAVAEPGAMLRLLGGYTGSEGTLTLRQPPGVVLGNGARLCRLASPPLDRDGVLVQFRLPEDHRHG